jgi:hypothetical protein
LSILPVCGLVLFLNRVRKEVSSCTVCDRVKANFEVKDPALKPLPIMGMFIDGGLIFVRCRSSRCLETYT